MKLFNQINRSGWLQKTLIIICIFLVLGAIGFLGRGIWRSNILPAYASFRHKNDLEITHNLEVVKVNKALKPLGLDVGFKKASASCGLDIAISWRTSIYCSTSDSKGVARIFTKLPTVSDTSIKQVKASLESDGWEGGMDVSGGQLLYYGKNSHNFKCTLQLWITGTNQSITPRLYCSQTYTYLGDPYGHL